MNQLITSMVEPGCILLAVSYKQKVVSNNLQVSISTIFMYFASWLKDLVHFVSLKLTRAFNHTISSYLEFTFYTLIKGGAFPP